MSERASAREPAIDLNAWHRAIHEVTGDMALRFNRATADDLERWSRMLRVVAEEMDRRESMTDQGRQGHAR